MNKKERAMSIRQFLGFFLLAMLPMCIGIYMYARTDAVENDYMRKQMVTKVEMDAESEKVKNLKVAVNASIMELTQYLSNNVEASKNKHGEIERLVNGNINSLQNNLTDLYHNLNNGEAQEYIKMMIELKKSLDAFNNEVYEPLCTEREKVDRDLNICGEARDQLEKQLKQYQ